MREADAAGLFVAGFSGVNAEPSRVRIALVAGEHSGDQLGFKLMRALREADRRAVAFSGVGGEAMEAEGLQKPVPDRRHRGDGIAAGDRPPADARRRASGETAEAIVAARPDALVIIDSPDFTHRVARRVRRALPGLPVDRLRQPIGLGLAAGPGARRCAPMSIACSALLPFEPEAHARLGGPRCVYVGHPLIERLDELRPNADEARRRDAEPPLLVVLPGSRRSEIARLMADFGGALGALEPHGGPFELVLPTLPHVEARGARARGALACARRASWSAKRRSSRPSAPRARRSPPRAR